MVASGASRKNKKAWRKNILDHKVREAISQQIKDELRGGAVEGWEDEKLFVVDKKPFQLDEKSRQKLSRKEKYRNQILYQQTTLAAQQKDVQPNDQNSEKRLQKSLQQKKTNKASKQLAVRKKISKQKTQDANLYDLWDDDSDKKVDNLDQPKPQFAPQKSKLNIPVLEVADPGQSYNPEPTERESKLDEVYNDDVRQQIKAAREKLHVKMVPPTELGNDRIQQILAQSMQDMQGDQHVEETLEEVEKENQKVFERKTRVQRNKEKRLLQAKMLKSKIERLKRQRRQLDHLQFIQSEIDYERDNHQKVLESRQKRIQEKLRQAPKLGRQKYVPLDENLLMSEEVGEGLRRLKPCSNLALERFKSIQKRGLIEPRTRLGYRKKSKIKLMEKNAGLERSLEMQKEINKLRKKNRELKSKQANLV